MSSQEVREFVSAALECSVYVSPREPGLTREELLEAGTRAGYFPGELLDSLQGASYPQYAGVPRLLPRRTSQWGTFIFPEVPEYRNIDAFEFVYTVLRELVRKEGVASACIEHSVLVARAVAQGLPERDVEAAVFILAWSEYLAEDKEHLVRFARGKENYATPRTQVSQNRNQRPIRRDGRARAYPIVEDIISRRVDGRPLAAEPFEAFAAVMDRLGYGRFLLWWRQIVAELRRLDATNSPVAVCVLSAALVEASLVFVVQHARAANVGPMMSKDFDGPPRSWKLEDLVKSASAGRDNAILDVAMRSRVEELLLARQRIHAGRMLTDHPTGVQDLRPEEARAAKLTAEGAVRCVLDWVARNTSAVAP